MALARDRFALTTAVVTGASTNYAPVTGFTLGPAQLGATYHWKAVMACTVAAATTGIRFGPSAVGVATAATTNIYFGLIGGDGSPAVDGGTASGFVTTGSTTGGYTAPTDLAGTAVLAIIEGIYTPSVVGQTLQLEVGPEAAAAVTIAIGSYFEWERTVG